MNKLLSSLVLTFSATSLFAADYYLQANMPTGTSWAVKANWYDAPTGGSVMADTTTFGGNHFFLNGWDLRTGSSASAESSFGGTSLNITQGAERLLLMSVTCNINYDLNVSGGDIMVHTTRQAVTLNVVRNLTATGTFAFRGTTADNYLTLVAGALLGSGDLYFGNKAASGTDLGSFSISAADASGFTGRLIPNDGTLTIASADFANATLVIDMAAAAQETNPARVNIDLDASFRTLDGEGLPTIDAGNYTAAQLNSLLGVPYFTGGGSLTIAEGHAGQAATWQGFPVQDVGGQLYVDTAGFMGWMVVNYAPYAYSVSLNAWVYIPDNSIGTGGGWVYLPRW